MKYLKTFENHENKNQMKFNENKAPLSIDPDTSTSKTKKEINPRENDDSGDRPRPEGNRIGNSNKNRQREDAIELCFYLLDNDFNYSLTTTVISNVIESYIGRNTPEGHEIIDVWREIFR